MSEILFRLRLEADEHETVYESDRRRKKLLYDAANEIERHKQQRDELKTAWANAAADLAIMKLERDELLSASRRLEVSANTVAYCYERVPQNFASALMDLSSDAELVREAIAKVQGDKT